MEVLHTTIAIALVVVLIIWVKVDPVISLVLGSLYLGFAAGVGPVQTLEAITTGFGEIMVKVGLLIGFGVLIGALLHALGTFRKLVEALIRVVGPNRMPLAMTTALSAIFPSIYVDVQVVLASPIARSTAPHMGPGGLPRLAGAIGAGIFCGYVFVVPGLAMVTVAGLVKVELGTWLLYGVVIGIASALITTILYGLLVRIGIWNAATDEDPDEAMIEQEEHDAKADLTKSDDRGLPLLVCLLPILVPLVMIGFGAFAKTYDFSNSIIETIGNANLALFVGLLGAYALTRVSLGTEKTEEALSEGFHTSGEILLITGIGGSLGEVIARTGLETRLADLFSADASAPIVTTLLLAWVIAAVLHIAIGSVSVAAIAAAGIIGPVIGQLDIAPVAIGLAIASGALFALHVNSNFFWMFKALLGLSTSGTLKSLTVVTSIASVVSLPMVAVVALIA